MDYPDILPSTQMLDSTQPLQGEEEEEDKNLVLGTLVIDDHSHNITSGTFKIGRDPTQCDIVINNPMLSKVHVIIEAEADGITVQDEGSRNGTKKGKKTLKPSVRYNNLDCIYWVLTGFSAGTTWMSGTLCVWVVRFSPSSKSQCWVRRTRRRRTTMMSVVTPQRPY